MTTPPPADDTPSITVDRLASPPDARPELFAAAAAAAAAAAEAGFSC